MRVFGSLLLWMQSAQIKITSPSPACTMAGSWFFSRQSFFFLQLHILSSPRPLLYPSSKPRFGLGSEFPGFHTTAWIDTFWLPDPQLLSVSTLITLGLSLHLTCPRLVFQIKLKCHPSLPIEMSCFFHSCQGMAFAPSARSPCPHPLPLLGAGPSLVPICSGLPTFLH